MKSYIQISASLLAVLANFSQSAIATPINRVMLHNAIDSYQLSANQPSIPSKIEFQPPSLVAQQSDICKPGTIPVSVNAPNNVTPSHSGKLQPGVNSGTRCIFFKDVSLSVRASGKSKTWLIIHGWLNNSDSEDIKALAVEVARQNPEDRVLMLDWGEAAMNGGNTALGSDQLSLGVYYAATWIRPIAEVVVDKLKSDYGLTEQEAGKNLNIIGHSLGTLMAGEIGAVYSGMNPKGEKDNSGSPINSIIALDPPSEASTTLNLGGYDVDGRTPAYTFKGKNFFGASQRDPHPEAIDRPKKFSDVSRFSRAFVGAKSVAGNQEFASWAHESFSMDFGNKFDRGEEHGRVVKAFTKLISEHPFKQPNSKNRFLDLSNMRAHNNCVTEGSSYSMKCNTVDRKHEGTIEVNSSNTSTLVKFTTSSGEQQQIAATQSKPIATKPNRRHYLGIVKLKEAYSPDNIATNSYWIFGNQKKGEIVFYENETSKYGLININGQDIYLKPVNIQYKDSYKNFRMIKEYKSKLYNVKLNNFRDITTPKDNQGGCQQRSKRSLEINSSDGWKKKIDIETLICI